MNQSFFKKDYAGQKALDVLKSRILVDGYHLVVNVPKSHGSYIHNELDGKEYLDFYSFFASLPIGFNHPGLKDADYQAALMDAAQNKLALSDVYSPHFARFVDCFDKVALREQFRYLFFIEGGTMGVANAMKVAFDWKSKWNKKHGKNVEADQIIHFQQAFHGRGGYTLSCTDSPDPRKAALFPRWDWPRIFNPKIHAYDEESHSEMTIEERESKAMGEIRTALERLENRVAAILIEPIQGEGGDNHFRKEFLQALRNIADEQHLLLIFDEVQTGMGLTGLWWCWEHFGVQPDLMACGKKLQVGAVAATDRLDEEGIDHCWKISSRINSTFGGNLVDMVRATRYMEIIESEKLLNNITKQGETIVEALHKFAKKFPLTNIRHRGGMIAFDLPTAEMRNKVLKTALEQERVILLASGKHSIRLRPNLSINNKEVGEGLARVEKALAS